MSLLPSGNRLRGLAVYGAMLVAAVLAYVWIRARGVDLIAPHAAVERSAGGATTPEALAGVLLALAAITVVARGLGVLVQRYLGQPAVIGEILGGLLLGPSVLGSLAPEVSAWLLPAAIAPSLGLLSTVGVVLFMFLVGLELDPRLLRRSTQAALAVSHASIVVPFLLGSALALWLYPVYGTHDVDFTTFSLFTGISLSVTAFPVLARILTERNIQRSALGVTALSCAAVNDVTAWTLLALVVGVAQSKLASAVLMIPLVLAYVAFMFVVVRPFLTRLAAREEQKTGALDQAALAAVFVALLLSAWATEALGIHGLFGAFLLGALMPHEGRLAEQVRARLEDVVVVLFLPAFFAFTGLRTQVALVDGAQDWFFCALIVVAATLGKLGGSFVAARLAGLGSRASAALGILMNTRGLMELVVLNIGLDLGVISPVLFAMFVIMALVTTCATTPLLNAIVGRQDLVELSVPLASKRP